MSRIKAIIKRPDPMYEGIGKLVRYFSGKTCDDPIFIIGTGRCGTTLLVDIVRTNGNVAVFPTEALDLFHPALYPYSERKVECVAYWKNPRLFTRTSIDQWPTRYARKLKDIISGKLFLSGGTGRLIIKNTMMIYMISEIRALFENSRFIHIYRHGIPFMNSYVRKEWPKYQLSYGLDEFKRGVCRYWNDCIMEVESRKKDVHRPLDVLEISYEELCSQPERVMGRVADYIDCSQEDFDYDYGVIDDRNKASGNVEGVKYKEYLELMRPGLEAKGYI